MLLACHPQARSDSTASEVTVLELSKPVYQPAHGSARQASEEAMCNAWSLDTSQARSFFRLSKPLREGELHDYGWLPCSIKGRVQAEGRIWDSEINAAGTSTWRNGNETRLLGCAQAACEPLVILMPEGKGDG